MKAVTPWTRMFIYEKINSERDYQDRKWGGKDHDSQHSILEWLMMMERYTTRAKQLVMAGEEEIAKEEVRKITALGVACMEIHGAPPRY